MPPEIIELVRDWEPALLISVVLNGWLLWERVSIRRDHAESLREHVRAMEAVKTALVDVRIALAREGR